MKTTLVVCLGCLLISGCDKPDKTGASSTATTPATPAAPAPAPKPPPPPAQPATAPAQTAEGAEPAPENLTPSEKPPFEAVVFRRNGKKNDMGWAEFDAYNLGNKPVIFLGVYGYAYDKDGKQVGRTKTPFSWNGKIEPGKKSDFPIRVGNFQKAPDNADSFELCYANVRMEGDDKGKDDSKRCPEQRKKSK